MKIHPIIFGLSVTLVFFGIILGFQSAGVWSTSGKTDSSGKSVQPSIEDVETIKGWMTLGQIASTYKVSISEIITAFNLPENTSQETAIKDLESDTFSTDLLKEWLLIHSTSFDQIGSQAEGDFSESTAITAEPSTSGFKVTGSTTFQDLLDWGLQEDIITQIIGAGLPQSEQTVKDYTAQKGIEFSLIKTRLQAEVDKLK